MAQALESSQLSLRAAAAALEVTHSHLSKVIRAERTPPLDRLPVWADVLKIPRESAQFAEFRDLALRAHGLAWIADGMRSMSDQLTDAESRISALERDYESLAALVSQRKKVGESPARYDGSRS